MIQNIIIENNKKKFVKSFGLLQKAFVKASAKYQKKYATYAASTINNNDAPCPPPKPPEQTT